DVLHRLAEEKAFDEAIEKSPSIWMDQIAAALRTLLPKNIIYNLTAYNATRTLKYTSITINIYNITATEQGKINVSITSPTGKIYKNQTENLGNGSTASITIDNPELGNWTITIRWNVMGDVSYYGHIRGFKEGAWSHIASFNGEFKIGFTQGREHEYYFWLYDVKLKRIGMTTNIEDPKAIVRASEVGEAILTYTYSSLKKEFYTLVLHLTLARTER
ncbi:MAG: hypothetical protein QW803_13235, partial [Candidatus Methanomethylicia archaeon]